jgi:baculoviral IAP repeat-containing protein 6
MSENILIISDDEDEFLQQGPLTAWTCPDCTVENQATYLICDCCGQERPSNQIITNGVNNTNQPWPPKVEQQQQQQQGVSRLDSQPTQEYAAPIIENIIGAWTCSACTFINSSISLVCDVCGTPGIAAETADPTAAAATTATNSAHRQQQQQEEEDFSTFPLPPALHIPITYNFSHRYNYEDSSQKVYDLDCGCCGPFKEIKEAVRVSVVTLPSAPSLLCLLRHFSCPADAATSGIEITPPTAGTSSRKINYTTNSNNSCALQLSGRDVKALLGAHVAAAIDRGFYSAATAASACITKDGTLRGIEDTPGTRASSSSSWGPLADKCVHLATAISRLFSAMTTPATNATPGSGGTSEYNRNERNTFDPGSGRHRHKQQQRARSATKASGVGYGGGRMGDDVHQHRHLKEEAAQRQRTIDSEIAVALRSIREIVDHVLKAEENFVYKEISPVGWLPLGIVGILNGSPLAACLRLLMCNDSLMDIAERREVYSEALQLVSMLASKQELIPLLLVPADGEILAKFASIGNSPSTLEEKNHRTKQMRRNREEEEEEKHGQRSSKRAKTGAVAALATTEEEEELEFSSFEAGLERSCWKALETFTLQCKVFMRSAQQLAGDGSEEDVGTVGTVLLVQETCTAVDEAVNAWRITHRRQHTKDTNNTDAIGGGGGGGGAGPSGSARHYQTTTPAAAAAAATLQHQQRLQDTTTLKQQYVKCMKKYAFRSTTLIERGDYYFRNQLENSGNQGGDGTSASRLRRVMRDIASLSTDLPVDWNSSILVINDETRMDAFRAVIFPPEESPYANGAFFFDILLPPEYPSSPPKVQFLTTGGGRVRFNPNLYDCGKVCLSLLGTWSGPSWDPKESSLLQVVVSIQAMILGESNPYVNEPGYESQLNTASGKAASDSYNRIQRYNTVKYSMLPAVQAVVAVQPKTSSGAAKGTLGAGALGAPKGFHKALKLHFKLKSSEIKGQLHQWKEENSSFNAQRGSGGGGRGRGRGLGGESIPDEAMENAVNSVVALLDQIVI